MVGRQYLEHLTDSDLNLMAAVAQLADVRGEPERIEALLDSPELFRRLFSPQGRDPLLQGSPFLLFAVLVHRASRPRSGLLRGGMGGSSSASTGIRRR